MERGTPKSASDQQIEALLHHVYVQGGYTPPAVAQHAFRAEAVRARGDLIIARTSPTELAGMVLLIPPGSSALQIAQGREAEMHLLAVTATHRRRGIGRALVQALLHRARRKDYPCILSTTQPAMVAAQRLYLSAGFQRSPMRDQQQDARRFLAFEKWLEG
ncbi:MAG: GNAT family N-acetyltransferase [Myxococcales bacterium]|nr:GNAT family N-acetyltransferase [Myxococcales bacterium]